MLLRHGVRVDQSVLFLLIQPMVWVWTLYYASTRLSRKQQRIVSLLVTIQEIEAVGPLAEMLTIGNADDSIRRNNVEDALITLLPRLKASDADRLTSHQRHCLYRDLLGRRNGYVLALLSALEQIGDSSSIPYVECLRVAKRPVHTFVGDLRAFVSGTKLGYRTFLAGASSGRPASVTPFAPHIQEAVERCLELLYRKAEQEQVSGTLLRAAGSPEPGSETLLRPAAAGPEVDPNELLRAGVGQGEI